MKIIRQKKNSMGPMESVKTVVVGPEKTGPGKTVIAGPRVPADLL